ncbi:aldo/keto reductase [Pelagicoccus sp. SDUM812003]|uniref:aldo/keto reductase n=1 Tax=Pelagicoccus sp. SDUM812003 TaxID=3041267 RepID=UPI00280C7BD8|nr:aldo/keto reductase [Pelagicoccus sp. SDUM812003]MDQ8203576.1 aldo/keto reductase [Pelagicoccus sp. SDUM812003]
MTQVSTRIELKKTPLGATEERVSELCLGCMLMGSSIGQEESFRVLDHFRSSGGNFMDTANCYAWWVGAGENVGDESEVVLGKWMRERRARDQVFLATKEGGRLRDLSAMRDASGEIDWSLLPDNYELQNAQTIRRSMDESLRRLRTDRVDLFYAHIMDERVPLEETLEALNSLVETGKARYLGCSNYSTERLRQAREICQREGWADIVAIQQQYSYLQPNAGADFGVMRNVDTELLRYLKENPEVQLLAYSPLLKGLYDDDQKRKAYYAWGQFESEASWERLRRIRTRAAEMGVLPSQLVYAWLMSQRPKVIPLLGFSRFDQYLSNLQSVAIELGEEMLGRLERAAE